MNFINIQKSWRAENLCGLVLLKCRRIIIIIIIIIIIPKKVGLSFASNFDPRKVNLLAYVKRWKQACLPSLLFGAELWTLTLLLKLERCQYWFLKHIFYVPNFAPGPLLLKLSGLNSIESEVATKKLSFLGRWITEPEMTLLIKISSIAEPKAFSILIVNHQAYYQVLLSH